MTTADANAAVVEGLLNKVRKAITRYSMVQRGDTIVVGFSGGPDSTALLHALRLLQAEWDIRLVAAHLHHGLRGTEADEDLSWVIAHCEAFGLELRYERADVAARRRRLKLSLEQAAREMRYAFLQRVAKEEGASRIAVGHTLDDRVETVLMHLLRGAGMEGLVGFAAVQGPLIRPLYFVRREETKAFCAALEITPRCDSSNQSTEFLRNRIRLELLPLLKAYYSDHVEDALARMAELLAADNEVLESLAREKLKELAETPGPKTLMLSVERLRALPIGLQRRVLRQAIQEVRGSLQDVDFATIEAFLEGEEGLSTQLPVFMGRSVRLRVKAGKLYIEELRPQASAVPWQLELKVPGKTEIARNGWRVDAVFWEEERELEGILNKEEFTWGVLLDPNTLVFPLRVRSRRPGDRIEVKIENRLKHRKLQDIFVDAHIPKELRAEWPVVVDASDRVLVVPGLAHAADVVEVGPNLAKMDISVKNYRLVLRFEAPNAYR
ncbi:tRNA lysidine(34) synthetase TilS [Chthonomonas calidirosea]|uniref:tRNA(Ile)-lysidine synthase n=1 Tax=Chthonomonas calidirosea (strain DSM 23976 / ICMP 18418 / T49) TaxID=1303518 RepID=S0EYF3_CHTCT|nr:tRNA lysidine(34) synthetase TilS [Chthonomonas calidirosea]CCW34862.1 tRNA(Ile)-lysidine synthetase, N-terminal domain/tRNA(Ile)-lysidine synthetase, C-terminal domain [Chthonomonas calidirosea T49]CEK12616.1 tRNA(Ile)-lysidine synthetase [Chthonomonas calidirosea]CEK13583.1 tRNA(Ile)-lysidine synthetase [Chthonomonas calidirosea]